LGLRKKLYSFSDVGCTSPHLHGHGRPEDRESMLDLRRQLDTRTHFYDAYDGRRCGLVANASALALSISAWWSVQQFCPASTASDYPEALGCSYPCPIYGRRNWSFAAHCARIGARR